MGTERDAFKEFFRTMGVPFTVEEPGRLFNDSVVGVASVLNVSQACFAFGADDEYLGVEGGESVIWEPREVKE